MHVFQIVFFLLAEKGELFTFFHTSPKISKERIKINPQL
jgi:hypothetical protein